MQRYVIERFTGPTRAVAIGAVDAESESHALRVADAEGLCEVGDYYRAASPALALERQLNFAHAREGYAWQRGDAAACGILACAVRVLSDDGSERVRVAAAHGQYDVLRGSLVPMVNA